MFSSIHLLQLNNKLNGCSLEQDGEDFYIVGADAVRKKLGSAPLAIRTSLFSTGDYVNIIYPISSIKGTIVSTQSASVTTSFAIYALDASGNITKTLCSYSGAATRNININDIDAAGIRLAHKTADTSTRTQFDITIN